MNTLLSSIPSGETVIVEAVKNAALKPKLMEMGFIHGKALTVLFRAPFGDPIAVDIQGYILSLRLDEAALIEVREYVPSQSI